MKTFSAERRDETVEGNAMNSGQTAKYVAFSGGVGGAKLVLGLARVLAPEDLLIVGNTGDDFEHLGMTICPDLDTLMYTLAGRANNAQGWGVEGETWQCMQALSELRGSDWFQLGDRDLAIHLRRSERLRQGELLSVVTKELNAALGVRHRIVPVSEDAIRTIVLTATEELSFQDYFVRRRSTPALNGFRFEGADGAVLHEEVEAALTHPGLLGVFLCPSNPFVSIGPMLALPKLRSLIARTRAPVIAVSPIVDGQAIKGPAAKMMRELGLASSALGIAEHYRDLIDLLVIDELDRDALHDIHKLGLRSAVTQTVMRTDADKIALAQCVLALAESTKP